MSWQVDKDAWTKVAFACGERGCERHYDITHGYYTIHDSQIQRDTKLRLPCSNDESPMFLRAYEPQGSIGNWTCAQFGCKGAKETRGPFK
jgi:hypothetical protein